MSPQNPHEEKLISEITEPFSQAIQDKKPEKADNSSEKIEDSSLPSIQNKNNLFEVVDSSEEVVEKKSKLNIGPFIMTVLSILVVVQLSYVVIKFINIIDTSTNTTPTEDSDKTQTHDVVNSYSPSIQSFIQKMYSGVYLIKVEGSFTYPDIPTTIGPSVLEDPRFIPSLNIDSFVVDSGKIVEIRIGSIRWIFDNNIVTWVDTTRDEYVVLSPTDDLYLEISRVADTWNGGITDWRESLPFGYLLSGLAKNSLEVGELDDSNWSHYYLPNQIANIGEQELQMSFDIDQEDALIKKILFLNNDMNIWEELLFIIYPYDSSKEFTEVPDYFDNITEEVTINFLDE